MYIFLENKAFRAACFFVILPILRKENGIGCTRTKCNGDYWVFSALSLTFIPLCWWKGQGVRLEVTEFGCDEGGAAYFSHGYKRVSKTVEGQGTLQRTKIINKTHNF